WTQPSGSSNVYKTDTNGNIGIGTSSPQQPLHVQHSVDGWEAQFGRTSSVHVNVSGNQVQGLDGNGNGSPLYLNYSLGGNIYVGGGTVTAGPLPGLNVALGGASYVTASDGTRTTFLG